MTSLYASGNPPSGNSGIIRRLTVAVVDMVGYSTIARVLEENIDTTSVSDLNQQIQGFISLALNEIEDTETYCVLAKTGDGIILLFDRPADAHSFAYNLHLRAKEHSDQKSESTAKRWFRVGIASGNVRKTTATNKPPEFAGIAIANAVRLESAARAGEIVIDTLSFDELPPNVKALYSQLEIVKGKRTEQFLVRRLCVVPQARSSRPSLLFLSRRVLIVSGIAVLTSTIGLGFYLHLRFLGTVHELPVTAQIEPNVDPSAKITAPVAHTSPTPGVSESGTLRSSTSPAARPRPPLPAFEQQEAELKDQLDALGGRIDTISGRCQEIGEENKKIPGISGELPFGVQKALNDLHLDEQAARVALNLRDLKTAKRKLDDAESKLEPGANSPLNVCIQ